MVSMDTDSKVKALYCFTYLDYNVTHCNSSSFYFVT